MTDPFYKKTVEYKHEDIILQFKLSQDLFSSQTIDHGTARLLRTFIFEKINKYKKVLDLGCGVGPIGITLKAICPSAKVQMVDRDALAIKYTEDNAKLNNLETGINVYGSLGYDSVSDTDFDLIVSNIPAKVGEAALEHMIKDAQNYLVKDGKVVIVVVDAINDFIKSSLETDENVEVLYHRSWPGHHVYHYKFISSKDKTIHSNDEKFYRQDNSFEYKGREIILKTSHNLTEFDQLSFGTKMIISYLKKIKDNPRNFLIFNPGQGYIPLAITRQFSTDNITLVDRDLLALKTTNENLIRYDYPEEKISLNHQIDIKTQNKTFDIVIGMVPEKESLEVYQMYLEQINDSLKQGGQALLSSSSTIITRLEDLITKLHSFNVIYREKHKGQSLLLIKKVK